MKPFWYKSVFPIAAIFSFRMLGLFMLIPVFTVFASNLKHSTPALIGLALGAYGLSQGLLQMPFGMLSDRFGRKTMISIGLLLFAIGSLLGAASDSIYTMILARILQGTGAIGSVLIALIADLTPEEERTKAMAVIGMTIGLSFSLSMLLSPIITAHYGLSGIFYLTAVLAVLGLLLLHAVIPTPAKERFHIDSEARTSLLKTVLTNQHLLRLNAGIFFQHLILTATFFAIPLLLQQQIKAGNLSQQWLFYLPLLFFAFVFMIPFILIAEKKRKMKAVFLLSVSLTTLSQLSLIWLNQYWFAFCLAMFIYFIAFNILEASLPSLVSKQANPRSKGTAMGVYSSCQFLGIFVGGAMAGLIFQQFGSQGIFFVNSGIGLLWVIIASAMKPNQYLSTLILPYSQEAIDEQAIRATLKNLTGIADIVISREEKVIYLRVDKAYYIEGSAEKIITGYNDHHLA